MGFTEGLKEDFPVGIVVGHNELGTCVGIVDGTVVEGIELT